MGNCNAILGDDKQGNNEAPKARPSSVPSSNSSPAASLAPAAAPAQAEEVEVKIEEPVLEEPVEPIDPEDDPNYGLLDDDFAGNEGDHASRYGGGNSSVSKEVYIPVSFHGRLVGPKGSVRKVRLCFSVVAKRACSAYAVVIPHGQRCCPDGFLMASVATACCTGY